MNLILLKQAKESASMSLNATDDYVTLVSADGPSITIQFSEYFRPHETLNVYFSSGENRFLIIDGSALMESRDMAQGAISSLRVKSTPVITIYFDATASDVVVIGQSELKTNCEYELAEGRSESLVMLAAEHFPSAAKLHQKRMAKAELLAKVNPMDSIVALEQQLDLLSLLVIQHFDTLPVAQRPVWYASFKSAVSLSGTQTLRPQSAGDEFLSHKEKVRELQAQYFESKPEF